MIVTPTDDADTQTAPPRVLYRRTRRFIQSFAGIPEVVTPFYPSGEVLAETASTLLIRWRLDGVAGDVFQRAAFLLDTSGLKVKWGNYATTQAAAILPTLLPGDACNDADVLCYAHERIDGL